MSIGAHYPYLVVSSLLLLAAVAVTLFLPAMRTRALLSGALAAPSSLLSFAFVPAYWQPTRIASFIVGPEDLAFSFATGALVWALVERACGRGLVFVATWQRAVARHAVWSSCFLGCFLPAWGAGLRPMDATLLAAGILVPVLGWRCRAVWPFAVVGGAGFALLWTATLKAAYLAYPCLRNQWNSEALWGWSVLSVPGEEVLWALAFGSLWPLTVAWAFDARRQASRENCATVAIQ